MENFEVINASDGNKYLDFKPTELAEQVEFAKANKIDCFIMAWHPLDGIKDLSFLNGVKVRGLNINFDGVKSHTEINGFSDLQLLGTLSSAPVSKLDFSGLKKLEVLTIVWNNKIQGLGELVNLRTANIGKYKPASGNLAEFKAYKNLKILRLVQPVLESLDGIEGLKLSELEITRPKGLKYFFTGAVKKPELNLKELNFSFCKELDYDTVPPMENLTDLGIMDGGKIATLERLLAKFPNLTYMGIARTEIEEGNLDYILEHPSLRRVTIDHKKHYNKKEKEINAILAQKHAKK
jgi:hypothetical protein